MLQRFPLPRRLQSSFACTAASTGRDMQGFDG